MSFNDPSQETEDFLTKLENGEFDDVNTQQGAGVPPPPPPPPPAHQETPSSDDVNINDFMVDPSAQAEGEAPQDPPAQSTQVSSPPNNGIDPLELQRQLYIAQGQNQAYQNMMGKPQPVKTETVSEPEYMYDPATVELTDDERELIKESRPLVDKIAKSLLNQLYRDKIRPLQEKLTQYHGGFEQLRAEIAQERARNFQQAMHREIPDLAKTAATPEFQSYLKQAAPRSGGAYTVEQELMSAIQTGNMGAIKEIVGQFRPTPKPGAQHVAPGKPQSGTPPTAERGPTILAYSKLVEAEYQFNAGLITSTKYNNILDMYKTAELEGRVDYDR